MDVKVTCRWHILPLLLFTLRPPITASLKLPLRRCGKSEVAARVTNERTDSRGMRCYPFCARSDAALKLMNTKHFVTLGTLNFFNVISPKFDRLPRLLLWHSNLILMTMNQQRMILKMKTKPFPRYKQERLHFIRPQSLGYCNSPYTPKNKSR